MKKIHKLSPRVIAKISAGEVIERPAYVVKELVENAIDAKADYITIQVEEAGLKKIIVTDNGEGMSEEDLKECFKPHTTSKILQEEDLADISSLGFRGEALSSIAAVSDVKIKSRIENVSSGVMIQIQEGKLIKVSPVGVPIGTSVIVERVFGNMPARKKFLKSIKSEFRHIVDVIMHYAIAFPQIRFYLSHDKRIILDFPQNQDILERISMLLGTSILEQLLPVAYEDSYITISGFISRPQINTHSTSKHFLFVNNRAITDRAITLAIKEAYGSLLESKGYPIFILFLTLPYETVDVNVHPRKEQVNFLNNQVLFEHVAQAVLQTLSEYNLTFQSISWKDDLVLGDEDSSRFGNTRSFAGKLLKDSIIPWELKQEVIDSSEVTQLHNVYLLMQTKDGVLLVDQHAAHERILFEQFNRAFQEQRSKEEAFSLPQTIQFEISISDTEILKEYLSFFASFGFEIEHFRGNHFVVSTVPLLFKDRDIVKIILEILEDIRQEKTLKNIDNQTKKMIAYLACKAAIKAGEKVSKGEAKKLVEQLEKTANNATCPHGRPTKIEMTKNQLDRMFRRK